MAEPAGTSRVSFSKVRVATYAILVAQGTGVAIILEVANIPLDVSLWVGVPYLCLLGLEWLFHSNRLERLALLMLVAFTTSYGLLALLDGLFLHAGILVTTDFRVSHLIPLFVPMHQLKHCLLVAGGLLLVRLCVFVYRRRHRTTFA